MPQTCGPDKFQCKSGQCIDETHKCDGSVECSDGSDETQTTCGNQICPDYLFRCSYGACINKSFQCDGKVQCKVDSSDEDQTLCNTPLKQTCTLPLKQPNLNFKIWDCDLPACQFGPGGNVPQGSLVTYSCDTGYKVDGSENVICLKSGWTASPPRCEKVQCPPISDDTLDVHCVDKNKQEVLCNKPVDIGTIAVLNCRQNFIQVQQLYNPPLKCAETGKWSKEPFQCRPECGKLIPKGVPYIMGGKEDEVGEFPWHVGLYFNQNKVQICGGSLISRKLVLTAAHCFKLSSNPESYTVIAGKFHRDWNTVDGGEQRLSVKSIEVNELYTGSQNRFANNIAILVLNEEVNITEYVNIVCLDANKIQVKYHLTEGSIGKVAGWGINENGTLSEKLQTSKIPFVGNSECRKSVLPTFIPFFSYDNFCAGYLNETSVCQGYGGGGLVFETADGNKKTWFLQGVVSIGQTSADQKCSKQRTLFTKVVAHMEWILDILKKYES